MAMAPNRMDAARDVSPTYPLGMYFLNALHGCWHDQGHESGCERGRGGNIHRFLLENNEGGLRHGVEGHDGCGQ